MGRYVIRAVPSGMKFDLKADNGQVIATSEVYESRGACLKGVESVRKASKTEKLMDLTLGGSKTTTNPRFEIYRDRAGEYRFRLLARNGKIVAASEGYVTHQGCLEGIASVRKNGPDASVETE